MNLRNKRGITLIALIVTIIVLMIIAGISIATLTADNGVLRQTNLAKVMQIENTAREQVKLSCAAMRMAIAEAHAKNNNYSAKDNLAAIQSKLLEIIKADNVSLEQNGWDTNNRKDGDGTFDITYTGGDYKQVCNNNKAEIIFTIKVGQKSIEIIKEDNSTLKDQDGNDVIIDIGADANENPGDGGGSDTDTETKAGLYETGADYTTADPKIPWDTLIANGTIHVDDNGVLYTNVDTNTMENASADVLNGDLVLPDDGSIKALGNLRWNDNYIDEENQIYGRYEGNWAFANCVNLTGIIIPNSVVAISEEAFAACIGLTSIDIPNSVTSIEAATFAACSNLESINIPDSVIIIDMFAFDVCTSLQNFTINRSDSTQVAIDSSALQNCTSLEKISLSFNGDVEEGKGVKWIANGTTFVGKDIQIYPTDITPDESGNITIYARVDEIFLTDIVEIGQVVNYDPTSGGNATSENTTYTSPVGSPSSHGNGYSADEDGQTYSASNYKEYGGKWRVLDKKGGKIILISDEIYQDSGTTMGTQGLSLYGAVGYLWAEEEIHRICSIYGHGEGADLEQTVTYYYGGPTDGSSQYGIQKTEDFDSGARGITINDLIDAYNTNLNAPYTEEYSGFVPTINTVEGYSKDSCQLSIYGGTPIQTFPYDLVINDITRGTYFVASRAVSIGSSYYNPDPQFHVQMISNNSAYYGEWFRPLLDTDGQVTCTENTLTNAIRAIVVLDSEVKTKDTTYNEETGWSIY